MCLSALQYHGAHPHSADLSRTASSDDLIFFYLAEFFHLSASEVYEQYGSYLAFGRKAFKICTLSALQYHGAHPHSAYSSRTASSDDLNFFYLVEFFYLSASEVYEQYVKLCPNCPMVFTLSGSEPYC